MAAVSGSGGPRAGVAAAPECWLARAGICEGAFQVALKARRVKLLTDVQHGLSGVGLVC
jgi:hypothetical protein